MQALHSCWQHATPSHLPVPVPCTTRPPNNTPSAAAWSLAHVVGHSEELAARAVAAGGLRSLVGCLAAASGLPPAADATVKRVAASALGDIAGHSARLAGEVVVAGALPAVAALLRQPLSNDARLKRQLLVALLHVCKADAALALAVVATGVVPDVTR